MNSNLDWVLVGPVVNKFCYLSERQMRTRKEGIFPYWKFRMTSFIRTPPYLPIANGLVLTQIYSAIRTTTTVTIKTDKNFMHTQKRLQLERTLANIYYSVDIIRHITSMIAHIFQRPLQCRTHITTGPVVYFTVVYTISYNAIL